MEQHGKRRGSYADSEGCLVGEEERIRHDALFYSQNPDDGLLLSGERARSLFIKSKLPLQDLSKIWKLADVTRDNMLDEGEFVVAIHLIQRRLCGFDIPESIESNARPKSRPLLVIKQANQDELDAYGSVFGWLQPEDDGLQNSETVLKFLGSSGLPSDILAKIWDLSDIDRDGKINKEEFFIALHLTRFCANNKSGLVGSVDVLSILPKKAAGESIHDKRRRRTEFQTDIRKLTSLREKLQSEQVNAESSDNKAAMTKIQFELDKTCKELQVITKKEILLREEITQMNLNTSVTTNIEVMRPFDRSFLMKRQSSGIDFLKKIKYHPGNCIFCEGVTSELFLGQNILDFARNLPLNPHVIVKRRDSRTSPKNQSHFIQNEKQQLRSADRTTAEQSPIAAANNDGNSSDDESDSVDIGQRRRRRNRPKSERDKLTRREPKSPTKIRSLSEAISDIEARTRAAKQEMDYRSTRSQSESDNKTDENSSGSSSSNSVSRKKEAYKKRSTSALELFQKLFSSDSETNSDKESPKRNRSLKGLQKTPWIEVKQQSQDSASEKKQDEASVKNLTNREAKNVNGTADWHGSQRRGRLKSSEESVSSEEQIVERINEVNNKKKRNEKADLTNDTASVEVDNEWHSTIETVFAKPIADFQSESFDVATFEPPKERPIHKQNVRAVQEDEIIVSKLIEDESSSKDIVSILSDSDQEELKTRHNPPQFTQSDIVNSSYCSSVVSRADQSEASPEERPAVNEGDEVTPAPHVIQNEETVKSLIDLLEETSCDSKEEELFRQQQGVDVEDVSKAVTEPLIDLRDEFEVMESSAMKSMTPNGRNKSSDHESSSQADDSTNDEVFTHSETDASDGGCNIEETKKSDDNDHEANSGDGIEADKTTKKTKKVLRTKSGSKVKSKSMRGLRSWSNPNRLSYVEECEWLDTLVKAELETIERRKRSEVDSPKIVPKQRKQMFTRSETIDEASLNLDDSRRLVKGLVDMELEGRKLKAMGVTLRDQKIVRDKAFVERHKSMPVGIEAFMESEGREFADLRARDDVSTDKVVGEKDTIKAERIPVKLNDGAGAATDSDHSRETASPVSFIKIKEALSPVQPEHVAGRENERQVLKGSRKKEQLTTKNSLIEEKTSPKHKAQTPHEEHDMQASFVKSTAKDSGESIDEISHSSEAAQSIKLQEQRTEESSPLKNIKTFKAMFEEKSSPNRPVDKYHKSMSLDIRPIGGMLTRSKSLGEGLNRPSDDSKSIQIVEKQPSVEKKDKRSSSGELNRRGSGDSKRRDVVYYEEAKMEMKRQESLEEDRKKKMKPEKGRNVQNKEGDEMEREHEEAKPTFKKVGDFRQLFEKGDAKDKKQKVITKDKRSRSGQQTENSQNKKEKMQENPEKNETKSVNILKSKKDTRHENSEFNFKDRTSSIDSHEGNSTDSSVSKELTVEDDCNKKGEDNIPSIKDRLMLFQTGQDSSNLVKKREKVIKRIRPKSYHGKSFGDEDHSSVAIDDNILSPQNSGMQANLKEDKRGESMDGRIVRDLGGLMLQEEANDNDSVREPNIKLKPATKAVAQTKDSSPMKERKENFVVKKGPSSSMKDENIDGFSYSKVVKDDRIRRELEEQEARENEIRQRLRSDTDEKVLSVNKADANETNTKANEYKPAEQSSSANRTSQITGRRTVQDENSDNKVSRFQNDRIRKEIEKQEARARKMKEQYSQKEESNKDDKKTRNMKTRSYEKDTRKNENSRKIEARREDTNGNLVLDDKKETLLNEKDMRNNLKSKKKLSKIEQELEEARRREAELEQEMKRREEERMKILQDKKRKVELEEQERKRKEEEELSKQNAVIEEKMKRQAKTRGLRALFETK